MQRCVEIIIIIITSSVLDAGVPQVMQAAGLEGQQVILLLEDYQFVHPAFLEMVNSLLSSGGYHF